MSDRELIENAAKAAGMNVLADPWPKNPKGWFWCDYSNKGAGLFLIGDPSSFWNPRTDDGDALRLAVKLGMNIVISDELGITDARIPSKTGWITEQHWDNTGAATRRAIVRAAAEIGKAMP